MVGVVGPATGESSSKVEHVGLVLSVQAVAKMDERLEVVMPAGDFFYVPPGHDSWVVGDEPYVSPAHPRQRAVQGLVIIFLSSGFVEPEALASALESFVGVNRISHLVTRVARADGRTCEAKRSPSCWQRRWR